MMIPMKDRDEKCVGKKPVQSLQCTFCSTTKPDEPQEDALWKAVSIAAFPVVRVPNPIHLVPVTHLSSYAWQCSEGSRDPRFWLFEDL